jgi:hypothetical protein
MTKMIRILVGLIVAHIAGHALAQEPPAVTPDNGNKLSLSISPGVFHFNLNGDYKHVWLVGVEREHPNGKIDGIAFFNNSFNQPSIFVFPWGGVYKGIFDIAPLSFKWNIGLMYGYVGEYQDRVPLNYKGFSPGANVSLAWQFTPVWSGQVTLAGSFLMFMINMRIP